jgi:hypothetical protein
MHRELNSAALAMLAGGVALFCAALTHGISTWDEAATDRAYVEAAARAVQAERSGVLEAEESSTRMWVPAEAALPEPGFLRLQQPFGQPGGPLKGVR